MTSFTNAKVFDANCIRFIQFFQQLAKKTSSMGARSDMTAKSPLRPDERMHEISEPEY